jgi:hypothetical protein
MSGDEPGTVPSLAELERRRGIPTDAYCGAIAVDWMLPGEEFDRRVAEGLRRHFPALTEEARRVLAGSYSSSHSK